MLKCLNLQPKHSGAWNHLGIILSSGGGGESRVVVPLVVSPTSTVNSAEECQLRSIEADPSPAFGYHSLAILHEKKGKQGSVVNVRGISCPMTRLDLLKKAASLDDDLVTKEDMDAAAAAC